MKKEEMNVNAVEAMETEVTEATEEMAVEIAEDAKELTLEERYKEITDAMTAFDNAAKAKNVEGMTAAREDLKTMIPEYNKQLRYMEYRKFLASGDETAVLNALKQGSIEQISVKETAPKDETPAVMQVKKRLDCVDLVELNEYAGVSRHIFVSGQWLYKVDKLGKVLGLRIAKDVESMSGKKAIEAHYDLSAEAQQSLNIKNPLSNNSLKTACQEIVDDIISGYIFKGKDLNFVLLTMTRLGKTRGSLVTPRKSTVIRLITEALITIVNDREYTLEIKEKKANK